MDNKIFSKTVSLYSLAKWTNGLAYKDFHFSTTGVPIIKIAELKNGITSQTQFTNDIFDESVKLNYDDLLFSWSGNPDTSIDVFRYRRNDGWLNQHIFKVVPNGVSKDYLFYLLKSLQPTFAFIASNKQTTGLGHVTIADLKSLNVYVHSLKEQRHIVDILGSIDEKIENNEQEIRKINDLALCFIAKSNNLNTELKPYIKFIKGKKPIENGSTTAPYLSIDAITSFRYESVYSDDMIMATPFDILMVMDGASSGTVFSHQAGVVSSTIAKIDCSDNIKDYLYWYLLSLKEIIKSRNTGSAIPHANKEYISSLKFDYGFATDIKTINILHSLRTRIIQLQEENKKLQELKGLYLKKFFE